MEFVHCICIGARLLHGLTTNYYGTTDYSLPCIDVPSPWRRRSLTTNYLPTTTTTNYVPSPWRRRSLTTNYVPTTTTTTTNYVPSPWRRRSSLQSPCQSWPRSSRRCLVKVRGRGRVGVMASQHQDPNACPVCYSRPAYSRPAC